MAYSLSGERPAVAAVTLNPLRAFGRWVAKARAARAQRVALGTLLEFDAYRLDDLGINRGDCSTRCTVIRSPPAASSLPAAPRIPAIGAVPDRVNPRVGLPAGPFPDDCRASGPGFFVSGRSDR